MAGQISDVFSVESELFRSYVFYCSVLVLKMVAMAPMTGLQRFKNKAFANPEDAAFRNVKPRTDENVERVRRYKCDEKRCTYHVLLRAITTAGALRPSFVGPQIAPLVVMAFLTALNTAHLNDVENIPIFFLAGFVYILTNPPTAWAVLLFRAYTAARFVHTFVYAVCVVPQPARFLAFGVGLLITGYMGFLGAVHFM